MKIIHNSSFSENCRIDRLNVGANTAKRRLAILIAILILFMYHGNSYGNGYSDNAGLVVQVGHSSFPFELSIDHAMKHLASIGNDQTIKLWEVATGKEIRTIHIGYARGYAAATLSGDAKFALIGRRDGSIELWSILDGRLLRTQKAYEDGVICVAFSPDNNYAISSGIDGKIKIWSVPGLLLVRQIDITPNYALKISVSDNLENVLIADESNQVILYDKEGVHTVIGRHSDQINSLKISHDGRFSLTVGADKQVRLWDLVHKKEEWVYRGHTGSIFSACMSSDIKYAVSGGNDNIMKIFDMKTGLEVASFRHSGLVGAVAISEGNQYAFSGAADNAIRMWDLSSGKVMMTYKGNLRLVHSVHISSDGKNAVIGSDDGKIKHWDLATGGMVRQMAGHKHRVSSVMMSPDGSLVLSGGGDGALILWRVNDGTIVRRFSGHKSIIKSVNISPDGKTAISGSSDTTVGRWDLSTDENLSFFRGHSSFVKTAIYSSDGKYVFSSGSDKIIKIWEAATGKVLKTLEGHTDSINCMALSPDGKYLVSGDASGVVKLWSVDGGNELADFSGHTASIYSVLITPDSNYVISAGADRTIRIWDIDTGRLINILTGHTNVVSSLSISESNYNYLLSGSWDKSVILWDFTTGKWLAKLYSFTDGTWAVVDPEGRYDASNGGDVQGLHWVVGNTPIDLSQLKERYYEPGLLAKIMGYNKEPLKKVESFTAPKLFPEVSLSQDKADASKIDIDLKNQGGGIGKVRVLVNGKEIAADARGPKTDPDAKETKLTVDLSGVALIPDKENNIEVIAWNKEGYLSSRGRVLTFKASAVEQVEPPTLYAIVMGVSNYADPRLNLTFSGKDAADMAKALKVSAKRLFGTDKVNMTLLTDYRDAVGPHPHPEGEGITAVLPSRENLKRAFESARKAKPTDVFVVYLAGHGVMTPGEDSDYHYLTKEARTTDLSDPAVRGIYAVSSSEITEWIKKVPALKQVMILDTCAAGGAATKLTEKRALSSDQIRSLERLKDRTGFHVLMGSAADAVSWEASQYGQGLLTYALLQGIRGAALREDEYVDVQKLFSYAADQVPQLAKTIGGIQRPVIAAPRGTSFDIGQVKREDKEQIPMAIVKPLVLRSVFQAAARPVDNLGLTKLVNAELRESSAVTRGGKLVYVDADELPGAYTLSGRYGKTGDIVKVEAYLFEGEREQAHFTVEGKETDLPSLARGLVVKAAEELGE